MRGRRVSQHQPPPSPPPAPRTGTHLVLVAQGGLLPGVCLLGGGQLALQAALHLGPQASELAAVGGLPVPPLLRVRLGGLGQLPLQLLDLRRGTATVSTSSRHSSVHQGTTCGHVTDGPPPGTSTAAIRPPPHSDDLDLLACRQITLMYAPHTLTSVLLLSPEPSRCACPAHCHGCRAHTLPTV
jgi:hypothetical protein